MNSFRRDRRRKFVAIAAVALATCLATFLLHWSLNLGDRIQEDLRAYGTNLMIVPLGESLSIAAEVGEEGELRRDVYLKFEELKNIQKIFWRNQIVGMAPVLPVTVRYQGTAVTLVGTEFGKRERHSDLRKVAPYLELDGRWPDAAREAVSGELLAERFGWKPGQEIELQDGSKVALWKLAGVVRSGGPEDHQLISDLDSVQQFSGRQGEFKHLLVSALVTPVNELYLKHSRNPESLTPQESERFFCTPYLSSVADDIVKAFSGAESRIFRQVSQTEEKIVKKVNWLMVLVTLAGLIASSLTMTSTTTAMILERRKELALMKAIGSNSAFLVIYLFSEILILGAAGSLCGYILGSLLSVGLSGPVFQSTIEIKWIVLPVVSLIGVFIILCGSLWPLRQAVTLEAAEALRDL